MLIIDPANYRLAAQVCSAPKPPLCKGRWHGKAVTEGLCSEIVRICHGFRRIGTACCDKPSVKNLKFLTAPFTQGRLGRSRASAINDHLSA